MGGIMILTAIVISVLLWAYRPTRTSGARAGGTDWLRIIGFVDDYRKVVRKDTKGLDCALKIFLMCRLSRSAWPRALSRRKRHARAPTGGAVSKDVMPQLGPFYYLCCPYFVIVGTGNAVNLTDGLMVWAIMPIRLLPPWLLRWWPANMNFANSIFRIYAMGAGDCLYGDCRRGIRFCGLTLIRRSFMWAMPIVGAGRRVGHYRRAAAS